VSPAPDPELPRGDEKAAIVRDLFDTISPRYDLVNRVMTFGMDVGWRRRTVRELGLPPGSRVLDVACGTGDLCRELAAVGHRPVGIDSSLGMLMHARTTAPLIQADALRMPVADGAVDGVTCGFALRNVVSLDALFAELGRVVRPGGRIALLDASRPDNRVLRAGHGVYFGKVVPAIGGLLSDGRAYAYLPRSMAYLPPAETMLGMLRDAGFPDVRRAQLSRGLTQLIVATRTVRVRVTGS
jgi:demethylmenaquinone methyltransferase/2-methoxy-6-polyprenyl-1,4-benzoquinol methylase